MKVWLLIFWSIVSETSFQQPPEKPLVSVFYESLCPYSREFITDTLYPTYTKLGSFIEIDLTPYGNVKKRKSDGSLKCQHGANECAINKLQACAIAKSDPHDQKTHIEFVNCIEKSNKHDKNVDSLANKCCSKLELSKEDLLKCSKSHEGDDLFVSLGDKQKLLAEDFNGVPAVYINYKKLEDNTSLYETLCKLLKNQPKECAKE